MGHQKKKKFWVEFKVHLSPEVKKERPQPPRQPIRGCVVQVSKDNKF